MSTPEPFTILITGASRGIGLEMTRQFAGSFVLRLRPKTISILNPSRRVTV